MHTYSATVAAIHTLRVNIKSLAYEATAIRKEEARAGALYVPDLHSHRVGSLRAATRIANLAIAFVRGRKYRQVERMVGRRSS